MLMMNHYYSGPLYVNTYLVYDTDSKDAFIVDPGGVCPEMEEEIAAKGLQPKFIILTHGHGDHIGGVPTYRQKYQVPVLAHADEKELLSSPAYNSSKGIYGHDIAFGADRWLQDGEEIPFGENTLRIIHTPGHSPGGICILVNDWLFSGDTLFRRSIGRTDFALCSAPDLFASIRNKLFVLDPETEVFPGHEGFTTIGEEIQYNPFF